MNFLKNLEVVLSGFIHDLNNPIAVISGQSSIMKTLVEKNKITDEKVNNGSTKILTSTQKMGHIIQTLRNFYKPNAISDSHADLKLSIDTIYHLSIPKIFRNDLQVSYTGFGDDTDIQCHANPLILNLLFWNIHYLFLDTVEASPEFILTIQCIKTKDQAIIKYSFDNGSLTENYLKNSEMLVAKEFALLIGGEIESSSPKEISFKMKYLN